MSYTQHDDTVFTFYDESEEKLIESWLDKRGYTYWRPTVCGNCCGMYENFYAVDGISGKWKSDKDMIDFKKYASKNDIPFNDDLLESGEINPKQ